MYTDKRICDLCDAKEEDGHEKWCPEYAEQVAVAPPVVGEEHIGEWGEEYSGQRGIGKGDKCKVHDGDAMRNATVISVDVIQKTYNVEIDGIGTKVSNIPFNIWRPIDQPTLTDGKVTDGEEGKDDSYYPGKYWQPLFDLMHREHGLTLLDSELNDIADVLNKMQSGNKDMEYQAEWEFVKIMQENYNAAKSPAADESCFAGSTKKEAVIEVYEDLLEIIKGLPLKRTGSIEPYLKSIDALQPPSPTESAEGIIPNIEVDEQVTTQSLRNKLREANNRIKELESLPAQQIAGDALIKIRDLTAADVSDPLKALNHMQIIARDALIEQIEEIDFEQALSSTGEEKWVSEKPKEWQQCILLTATWDKRQKQWEFNSYCVVYIEGVNDKEEAAWYWALCDINGEEWDDINDLKADLYQMIELPSPSKPQQK